MTATPTWTPIHCLEQNVRLYLALTKAELERKAATAEVTDAN